MCLQSMKIHSHLSHLQFHRQKFQIDPFPATCLLALQMPEPSKKRIEGFVRKRNPAIAGNLRRIPIIERESFSRCIFGEVQTLEKRVLQLSVGFELSIFDLLMVCRSKNFDEIEAFFIYDIVFDILDVIEHVFVVDAFL